jgi:hypothetical protein
LINVAPSELKEEEEEVLPEFSSAIAKPVLMDLGLQ